MSFSLGVEFIVALAIVITLFKIIPFYFWIVLIGCGVLGKIILVMFSTRNLERHGRHFKV